MDLKSNFQPNRGRMSWHLSEVRRLIYRMRRHEEPLRLDVAEPKPRLREWDPHRARHPETWHRDQETSETIAGVSSEVYFLSPRNKPSVSCVYDSFLESHCRLLNLPLWNPRQSQLCRRDSIDSTVASRTLGSLGGRMIGALPLHGSFVLSTELRSLGTH